MIVRLDLYIEIPCSEKELYRKVQEGPVGGMQLAYLSRQEYSDAEDHYELRWFESMHVPRPERWEDSSFNMMSHKARGEFRKALLDGGVQGRLDARLKAIWTLVGRQVDVGIWWTIESDDRDADVAEDADQDAYNRIMLSPLEQLATACQ